MVLNVHRNRKSSYGRGEGPGCMEVGEEGDYIAIAVTVTTRRWAAMRAILMFQ